jgi:pimeloyl-ACP methyl ester carboxylesterase
MATTLRCYGTFGPWVVLVHGGPGTGGYLAPLAEALADSFRVLEPMQRGSGAAPLTVARHVTDLEDFVRTHCEHTRPAIVGHSWGAMLALAHAAAHPESVCALVLVGCGTFDAVSRERLHTTVERRTSDELRRRIARLEAEVQDPDQRLRQIGDLTLPLYSYDLTVGGLRLETCDARAHAETWQDMLRLQERRCYPADFRAITVPVLMLHGTFDPHPGRSTEAILRPYLPQLEYRDWEHCGHYPWLERAVHADFVTTLRAWLAPRASLPHDTHGPRQ